MLKGRYKAVYVQYKYSIQKYNEFMISRHIAMEDLFYFRNFKVSYKAETFYSTPYHWTYTQPQLLNSYG